MTYLASISGTADQPRVDVFDLTLDRRVAAYPYTGTSDDAVAVLNNDGWIVLGCFARQAGGRVEAPVQVGEV